MLTLNITPIMSSDLEIHEVYYILWFLYFPFNLSSVLKSFEVLAFSGQFETSIAKAGDVPDDGGSQAESECGQVLLVRSCRSELDADQKAGAGSAWYLRALVGLGGQVEGQGGGQGHEAAAGAQHSLLGTGHHLGHLGRIRPRLPLLGRQLEHT